MIGGSLLMIAAASIALVFGWLGADPTLMWISIGASVAASVLLALGYNRSRVEVAAASRELARTRPPAETPAAGGDRHADEVTEETDQQDEDDVVANPERRRFHRPECRYAKVPATQVMSASAARARGYVACGICKP